MTINATDLGNAILAATFTTTIAKTRTFELAMKDFPVNAILTMLSHGAQRKFNDAVGGADKDADTKVALASAMIEEFKNGKVTKRREAAVVVDLRTKIGRKLVRDLLTVDDRKKLKKMNEAVANEKLDAILAKHKEDFAPVIDEEVAKIEAEAKRRYGLAKKVAVSI